MGFEPTTPIWGSDFFCVLLWLIVYISLYFLYKIIGVLLKEFGLPNPLLNNSPLKSQLIGINRSKGLTKNQKTTNYASYAFTTL